MGDPRLAGERQSHVRVPKRVGSRVRRFVRRANRPSYALRSVRRLRRRQAAGYFNGALPLLPLVPSTYAYAYT